MALRKGFPAKLSDVGADADDMRYNLAGQVVRSSAGVPRAGLFPPVTSLLTATATMNISVAAFSGVAVRDGGVVFLANDGPTNVLLDAAPGSNSRLDVIYAKQNDMSSTVTTPDANNTPILGVLKGAALAIPVRNPAGLPVGALELGTVLVPSTAVNTGSSGVVITLTFQYTAMNGGVVDFRTKVDLDLWTDAIPGQRAFVISDNGEYAWTGGEWKLAWSDTGWIAGTRLNSWAAFSTDFFDVGYRKRGTRVSLRGTIKSGTLSDIIQLPAGFRPLKQAFFILPANAGALEVYVKADGNVTAVAYTGSGTNAIVSLDPISFDID